MFANLADRFTNSQGDSFHAAWRDPDKSVTPAKVNTLQPAPATTKGNTSNVRIDGEELSTPAPSTPLAVAYWNTWGKRQCEEDSHAP